MREHISRPEREVNRDWLCDLNVAHEDVDGGGRHKENASSAGFTARARA